MWVMMICSRLSSGRFSQNSDQSGESTPSKIGTRATSSLVQFEKIKNIINAQVFVPPHWLFVSVLTFDFVGSSSANLGFTVLQEVLECWDQVIFGNFRSDCLLELKSIYGNKRVTNLRQINK